MERAILDGIAALEEDVLRGDGDADVLASARGRPGDALHESQVEDVDGAAAVEVLCGGGASGVEGVLEGGDVPIAVLVGGRRGSRAEERRHAERREERSLVSHLHISPFYAGRPAFYWYHYSIYGGGCQGEFRRLRAAGKGALLCISDRPRSQALWPSAYAPGPRKLFLRKKSLIKKTIKKRSGTLVVHKSADCGTPMMI